MSLPPLFLGLDGGIATCGLTIINSVGAVVKSVAFETETGDGGLVARARQMTAMLTQEIIPFSAHPCVLAVEAYRSSRSSKSSADTHYGRGLVDGMVLHLFAHPVPIIVTNTDVKAFCHPSGKAVDQGRKTDLEFRSALNMLDRVVKPDWLKKIANPEIRCLQKRWKQGRLHTLDAGALAGIARLMVQPDLTAHPHQRKIAEKYRGLPGSCPHQMSLRSL